MRFNYLTYKILGWSNCNYHLIQYFYGNIKNANCVWLEVILWLFLTFPLPLLSAWAPIFLVFAIIYISCRIYISSKIERISKLPRDCTYLAVLQIMLRKGQCVTAWTISFKSSNYKRRNTKVGLAEKILGFARPKTPNYYDFNRIIKTFSIILSDIWSKKYQGRQHNFQSGGGQNTAYF